MTKYDYTCVSPKETYSSKYYLKFLIIFFICCLLCISFIISRGVNDSNWNYQQSNLIDVKTCNNFKDNEKFDCLPGISHNETECLSRGCCWIPADINTGFTQYSQCFYPLLYENYAYVNVTKTAHGVTSFLSLKKSSLYPGDVKLLRMDITYESNSMLHIKIFDPQNKRYESLYPVKKSYNATANINPTYNVEILKERFGFKITRLNGDLIFDTQDKGALIFSEQFLQISAQFSGKIYGIGEHQGSFQLNTNWTKFTLFNQDAIPAENMNLYGSHPFYMVLEPNGSSHGVFLRNSNAMDVLLQPLPAVTFRTIGGILDFYFFTGPTPADVISQYTDLIGRPFMPPYWSLGFHLSRLGYNNLTHMETVLNRTLEAGIPLDTQWVDIDYMDNNNDFTVNNKTFADLKTFIESLHNKTMKFIPLVDPGISGGETNGTYPPYEQGLKFDIFIKNSDGSLFEGKVWNKKCTVFPDFTNRKTFVYWEGLLREMHTNIPFDGLWIDMNEPSNFINGSLNGCPDNSLESPPYLPGNGQKLCHKTVCMSTKMFAGYHYDLHNLYGISEAHATYRALRELFQLRPFVISRSTFPGSGHYAGHWSGDVVSAWHDMKRTISQMLSFSLYGIPSMGSDICGFNGNTTKNLCLRWSQLGAFYPFSRNHNTDDGIDQDPVALGPEVVNATKAALKIRYSLLPYLYTLFWKAHTRGETVARPLFFEFPNDTNSHDIDESFLWGCCLLIAPVLEEFVEKVTAYLPAGIWYDWYTLVGIRSNGQNFTLAAPQTIIPILIRGGSILPIQTPAATTTLSRLNKLTLLVAYDSNQSASGSLYWDDGKSIYTKEDNSWGNVVFNINSTRLVTSVPQWHLSETLILDEIRILGFPKPIKQVFLNGTSISFNFDSSKMEIWLNMPNWLPIAFGLFLVTQTIVSQELPWPPPANPDRCAGVVEEDRLDCHPEPGASEERCQERGCCWSQIDVGKPWCFYPLNFNAFESNGSVSHRKYRSQFPDDWKSVELQLDAFGDGTFNFKMFDPSKNHFSPPYPELNFAEMGNAIQENKLEFSFNEAGKVLTARRPNTKSEVLILEQQNLIFADQFVQFTWTLQGTIYGIGEHRSPLKLDQNWSKYTLWNHDVGPRENTNLYGSHPFFLVIDDTGLSVGYYFHNSNAMDIVVQPGPQVTFRSIGGILNVFIFPGPTPADVIKQYTALVGLPAMPPYWALGFHLCRWGYGSANQTRAVWQRMRDAGIPYDVQWNDIDYMQTNNDFTLDQNNFAELPKLVDDIHAAGMHYVSMLDPGVSASEPDGTYPPYSDGVDMDVFVKDNDGKIFVGKVWNPVSTVYPDFFHPRAVEYWQKQLQEFHDKIPYDAIWIDMNEPSNFNDGTADGCPDSPLENPPFVPSADGGKLQKKTLCMTAQHYAGRHYDLHNLYAIAEANVTRIAIENILKKRTFLITRASSSGIGRYAGHWAGDNYSDWPELRASIIELLTYSLFGVPFMGSDICGFGNEANRELCNRWTQLGAFYPFSRNHNSIGFKDQDPASFDQEFTDSAKRVLLFRYRFLPYLYTLMYRATVAGETVARPLFVEFPNDNNTYAIETTFLWGSGLLIVPVLEEGATSVETYLPAGKWWNLYDDNGSLEGGQTVVLPADFDTIPVLARGGTIFPTQEPSVTTTLSRKNPIQFVVALDANGLASGNLFWDDGETLGTIENNQYGLISMEASSSERLFATNVTQWNTDDTPIVDGVSIYGLESISSATVNGKDAKFASFPYGTLIQWSGTPVNEPITVTWTTS